MITTLSTDSAVGTPPEGGVKDRKWWQKKGAECAIAVTGTLQVLKDAQEQRRLSYVISERLYGGPQSASGITKPADLYAFFSKRNKATYNVVQSVIDTVTAKMSKNRPRPYFLTSGGSYPNRTRAKALNKFTEGVFNENDAYRVGAQAFRDACVYGDGIVAVLEKGKRVCFERVLPIELWVDEVEAVYGNPRQMHRVKAVDVEQLVALYPKHERAIRSANRAVFDNMPASRQSDMVVVRESWHLRSSKNSKDGFRCVTIDGHTLAEPEPYDYDFFPFARMTWCPPLEGFWGQGLADQLRGTQLEINSLLGNITRSMELGGTFKVLVPMGSKIAKEHLNSQIGAIVEYNGDKPPSYVTPPMVQPEIYSYLGTLIARAYEVSGVSQLSATGLKPGGLDSGKALREMTYIESDRFHEVGRRYEGFFSEIGKRAVSVAKDTTDVVTSKSVDIDWADIKLDETNYDILCFSVNSLPTEPAGRYQTITEYAEAGYLAPREAQRLLNYPDLEQIETLRIASEENLTRMLDLIVDEGEYNAPDPLDDLQLAEELAFEYIQLGRQKGLDEERLEMLQAFLASVTELQKQVAAEAQAEMAANMPAPLPAELPTQQESQPMPEGIPEGGIV